MVMIRIFKNKTKTYNRGKLARLFTHHVSYQYKNFKDGDFDVHEFSKGSDSRLFKIREIPHASMD